MFFPSVTFPKRNTGASIGIEDLAEAFGVSVPQMRRFIEQAPRFPKPDRHVGRARKAMWSPSLVEGWQIDPVAHHAMTVTLPAMQRRHRAR